jgi:thiol-disulfide isomerase/thioredoxin
MPQAPRFPLRLLVLSTVLALIAAVGTYVILDGGDDEDEPTPSTIELDRVEEGAADDEVVFTTYDGEVVPLASLQGTPLLVNFFSKDCVPCVKEMPALEEVHQELGDQVTFLGLAVQDRPEDARAFVEDRGVTYRTALDKDGYVINELGGTVLPRTVVLDANGEIVAEHDGELDADDIRSLLADGLGISP